MCQGARGGGRCLGRWSGTACVDRRVGAEARVWARGEEGKDAIYFCVYVSTSAGLVFFVLRRGESDSEVARKIGRDFLLHNGWQCIADSFLGGGAGAITN